MVIIIAWNSQDAVKGNPISDEIDRRTQGHTEGTVPQRWEQLYGLNEKKKAEREELRKQYDDIQAAKEQCTFHPMLVPYEPLPKPEGVGIAPPASLQQEGVTVEERTRLWKERKEKKLQSLKEAEQGKELEGCTFKPELIATASRKDEENKSSTSADAFVASMKSVERYIEKQKMLRQQKEQSQRKAEQVAGSGRVKDEGIGNVWTKKITVPKAPNFNAKAAY